MAEELSLNNLKKNTKLLEVLFQSMQADHLSREDFNKAFHTLTRDLQKIVKQFEEKTERATQSQVDRMDKAIEEVNAFLQSVKDTKEEMKQSFSSDSRTTMRYVESKMKEIAEMIPESYDDTEIKEKIEAVAQSIPEMPEMPKEFDPTDLKNSIDKLKEEVEKIKKLPIGRGGGVTDLALEHAMTRIVKSVTPTGTIDGANTDFSVPSTIHAVLGFELGSRVVSLGTYSITGSKRKTIVFDNPIPANYSDDSFVITYV